MTVVKRSLLIALLVGAFAAPAQASAAAPCRNRIYNDWYVDGKIASTYPLACYHDALTHMPADATIYSSLSTDIQSALQAAIARRAGKHVPAQVGKGGGVRNLVSDVGPASHDPAGASAAASSEASSAPSTISPAPVADASSGGGTPLPILILGAVAILLLAAGGIGAVVRLGRRRGAH